MAGKFFYIARDRSGNKITGIESASSQDEVASRLQAKDLVVINIITDIHDRVAEFQGGAESRKIRFQHKHFNVTSDDLTLFCRQLATLLGAGVTIMKSLNIISQQVSSNKLYKTIKLIEQDMTAGLSLHKAMERHPDVFTSLWVNLTESGEASGNLAMVLGRLASYLERDAAFRGKIISALIYPAILMCVGLGALLFMTIKIIPTFAELFKGFNTELPAITVALIGVSEFLRNYFLLIIISVIAAIYLFRQYIKTQEGRRSFEELLFRVPGAGQFFRTLTVERFTSEMSTMIESGVPILYALEIAEKSVDSLVLGEIIKSIKNDVREGKPIAQALDKSGFFDPMAVQMVAIGEEIGELSNMFKRLNVFYQEFIETALTRFTSLFEPIMLVFVGAIIALLVMGMFLPIFKLAGVGAG